MNPFCKYALHQIEVAVTTIIKIIDKLEDQDLQKRPTAGKHSIGELLEHIAMICHADLLISEGSTQEEMNQFYSNMSLKNLHVIKEALIENYDIMAIRVSQYDESELLQEVTSYWGTAYTRYEWLLEIIAHLYHHRGQLHSMLVHCYGKDPGVMMFE